MTKNVCSKCGRVAEKVREYAFHAAREKKAGPAEQHITYTATPIEYVGLIEAAEPLCDSCVDKVLWKWRVIYLVGVSLLIALTCYLWRHPVSQEYNRLYHIVVSYNAAEGRAERRNLTPQQQVEFRKRYEEARQQRDHMTGAFRPYWWICWGFIVCFALGIALIALVIFTPGLSRRECGERIIVEVAGEAYRSKGFGYIGKGKSPV